MSLVPFGEVPANMFTVDDSLPHALNLNDLRGDALAKALSTDRITKLADTLLKLKGQFETSVKTHQKKLKQVQNLSGLSSVAKGVKEFGKGLLSWEFVKSVGWMSMVMIGGFKVDGVFSPQVLAWTSIHMLSGPVQAVTKGVKAGKGYAKGKWDEAAQKALEELKSKLSSYQEAAVELQQEVDKVSRAFFTSSEVSATLQNVGICCPETQLTPMCGVDFVRDGDGGLLAKVKENHKRLTLIPEDFPTDKISELVGKVVRLRVLSQLIEGKLPIMVRAVLALRFNAVLSELGGELQPARDQLSFYRKRISQHGQERVRLDFDVLQKAYGDYQEKGYSEKNLRKLMKQWQKFDGIDSKKITKAVPSHEKRGQLKDLTAVLNK